MSNTEKNWIWNWNWSLIRVPLFDILGSRRILKKTWYSVWKVVHFWCISRCFPAFFIPGMYGSALFSPQLLGQPIEQPMTTNTSKHSPTEYNVRCGVIISSKRYAFTHLRCMLDVPENSCVPLLTVTPPPIFHWRRRRRKKIDRRAAAAGRNHPARRRGNSHVGAGLYCREKHAALPLRQLSVFYFFNPWALKSFSYY